MLIFETDNSKSCGHRGYFVVVIADNEHCRYCIRSGSCKAVFTVLYGNALRESTAYRKAVSKTVVFYSDIFEGYATHINGCLFNSPLKCGNKGVVIGKFKVFAVSNFNRCDIRTCIGCNVSCVLETVYEFVTVFVDQIYGLFFTVIDKRSRMPEVSC